MISRIADVLIDAVDIAAVLREGKQRLGERWGAARHLFDPAGVWNGHAAQAGLSRLEFLEEVRAVLSKQFGVERVDRLDARDEPRPFGADVRGAHRNRTR